MLPPLMSTINEQTGKASFSHPRRTIEQLLITTGIVLPEWQFGKLAGQISEREVNGKPVNGLGAKST
jgi:flotillin